jgi:hypothetical protein
MQYNASLPFRGNADKAFRLAESALTAVGFRITDRSPTSLEVQGPSMFGGRQNEFAGASRVGLTNGNGEMALDAELGGVERMKRFITLFPAGVCLFLMVVLTVVFSLTMGPGPWTLPVLAVTGGNAILWLILGPVIAKIFRARTLRALDTLLANMVAVGEAA